MITKWELFESDMEQSIRKKFNVLKRAPYKSSIDTEHI